MLIWMFSLVINDIHPDSKHNTFKGLLLNGMLASVLCSCGGKAVQFLKSNLKKPSCYNKSTHSSPLWFTDYTKHYRMFYI